MILIKHTFIKIKVIVDLPNFAERAAKSGAKAVGLVRLEGIIASSGKHPLYYEDNEKVDVAIASLHSKFNSYVCRPHIAFQRASYSDILEKHADYVHLRK